MAKLCGFPGKLGMDGSQVWPAYQRGEIAEIRAYCETDAANTYLLFLRFLAMRGELTRDEYDAELKLLRDKLGTTRRSLAGISRCVADDVSTGTIDWLTPPPHAVAGAGAVPHASKSGKTGCGIACASDS